MRASIYNYTSGFKKDGGKKPASKIHEKDREIVRRQVALHSLNEMIFKGSVQNNGTSQSVEALKLEMLVQSFNAVPIFKKRH